MKKGEKIFDWILIGLAVIFVIPSQWISLKSSSYCISCGNQDDQRAKSLSFFRSSENSRVFR